MTRPARPVSPAALLRERGTLSIRREVPTHPAARLLMENLTRELAARYEDEGGGHYRPEDAEREGAAFVIAYQGETPVGCGAARPLDAARGVAELKRMYVVPGARGQGVGAAVLHALEELALQLGFRELWLETGTLQPEAIRLYERAGFTPISSYGYHATDPRCRCFGKKLAAE